MNKEKLKEFLDSKELQYLRDKYIEETGKDLIGFLQYLDQKRKELEDPVYKTEDGFEVKEGDIIYWIDNKKIFTHQLNQFVTNPKMFFKLKENAENYLIEHAEVLSLKDINNVDLATMENQILLSRATLKQKTREKLKL